jgi:hypothetical protein
MARFVGFLLCVALIAGMSTTLVGCGNPPAKPATDAAKTDKKTT